jgi:hypothetical protein
VLGDRFLIAERSIAVDDETRVAAQYQVPHDPQTGLPDSHGATVAPLDLAEIRAADTAVETGLAWREKKSIDSLALGYDEC